MTGNNFNFGLVADALGIGRFSPDDYGPSRDVLRDIFRHCRGEDGKRVLIESFGRGWVDLNSPRAIELVSTFVALDDAHDLKQARNIARANLEAAAWNDELGIDEPIECRIKIHGARWAVRFQASRGALRGRERINEDLPPIPDAPGGVPVPVNVEAAEPAPHQDSPDPDDADDASAILREGGLPV